MNVNLALRTGVFKPREIVKISESLNLDHVFIPDVSRELDVLEIVASVLLRNQTAKAGPGVLRINEWETAQLVKRLRVLDEVSEGRAFLGAGLGAVSEDVKGKVEEMRERIALVKGEVNIKVYVASLKSGIATKLSDVADGIILNFATFDHAKKVSEAFKAKAGKKLVISYFKFFVSRRPGEAEYMAYSELTKYASMPQYYDLFRKEGVINEINRLERSRAEALSALESRGVIAINPSKEHLSSVHDLFVSSGVDVLVFYPYFSSEMSLEDKLSYLKNAFS